MFSLFRKKPAGEEVTFKIGGMHCTNCSLSIDGELEDTDGVLSAHTNYAQSKTIIQYDPKRIVAADLKKIIESLEYTVLD